MRFLQPLVASWCIFMSATAFSQHSTLNFSNEPFSLRHQSVLIVPFKSKMYLSDVNGAIAKESKADSKEIIRRLTQAIDQSFTYSFEKYCDVSSFYQLDDTESKSDLNYIYDHIQLEYELVDTEPESKAAKLKAKVLKKKEQDRQYKKGEISNGQVVTHRDNRERYMKAVVRDNQMLDSIHFKFDNKFFLFINELDIKNDYSDALAMQQMDYNREIKLHYTIYKADGELISTGISKTNFPSTENRLEVICSQYIPRLAEYISKDIFEEETDTKTSLKIWKK